MWPTRYFGARYFATRYWAKVGGDPVPLVSVPGSVGQVWPGLGFPMPGGSPPGSFF